MPAQQAPIQAVAEGEGGIAASPGYQYHHTNRSKTEWLYRYDSWDASFVHSETPVETLNCSGERRIKVLTTLIVLGIRASLPI